MDSRLLHATGYGRVKELFKAGLEKEAVILLKGLQDEYLTLCQENEILKEQLSEVAEVLDLAEKIHYDGHMYWVDDDGDRRGPFCQLCYDRDGILVHLQQKGDNWRCNSCKTTYATKAERPGQDASLQAEPLFT